MQDSIVIAHTGEFQHAGDYYRMCTWEPVGASQILTLSRVFDEQNLTLERALDLINAELPQQGGAAVIVTHANPDGLILRIAGGVAMNASRDALNLLNSGRAPDSFADSLGMDVADVTRIIGKMRQAQRKRIARIEIRGCRLGQSTSSMRAVQRFFGAQCLGAPRIFNAYGRLDARSNNPTYNYGLYDNQTGGNHYQVGADGHVGMIFERIGATGFRMRNARATSERVLRRWAVQNFPLRLAAPLVSGGHRVGTLYTDARTGEIDTDPYDDVPLPMPIHFQLDTNNVLTLPLESGYRGNLEEVCGTEDPLGF